MILTYEETYSLFRKKAQEIRRRFKGISFRFELDTPSINLAAKHSFYTGCHLKHLIKKNKKVKLDKDSYDTFIKYSRNEYKKAELHKKFFITATLSPSHRLYINREMSSDFLYDNPFSRISHRIVPGPLDMDITGEITSAIKHYKKRSVSQKKKWLAEESLSKIAAIKYDEAMEALEENGSITPNRNDTGRYVGVEIECASKLNFTDMRDLIARKAPSLSKYLRLGEDGSIRTEEGFSVPIEFRFLMKEQEKDKVLTLFQKVVGPYIKVNDSCGLHVHLDMRSRKYERSFERLVDVTPILMSMVPKSRRENQYCLINKNKKEHAMSGRNSVGRYRVVNPQSYNKYKTLEVRVHSATKNASKIIAWINLLTLIIDKEFVVDEVTKKGLKEPKRRITNLISFFTRYEVPAALRNYVTMRIAKFGRFKELSVPKELETVIPAVTTEVTTSQDEAS